MKKLFDPKDANRIVDKIVAMMREETAEGTGMLAVFVGVMLALMSILRAAPDGMPPAMTVVKAAIELCLADLNLAEDVKSHPISLDSKPN